jgi:hypothetical protein
VNALNSFFPLELSGEVGTCGSLTLAALRLGRSCVDHGRLTELMRIIVAAALCFLIAFGVGLLLPFHRKNETCSPKMTRGFDCRNTCTLSSFFLCRLKLRYAFLQNSNSAFEVIYRTARRVKFLLAFERIFRNQFLEKVYVALQATCSSHHAFFHRADFHTRNILWACGAGTERYADGKNQRLPDHNPVPERSCEAATRAGSALLQQSRN